MLQYSARASDLFLYCSDLLDFKLLLVFGMSQELGELLNVAAQLISTSLIACPSLCAEISKTKQACVDCLVSRFVSS